MPKKAKKLIKVSVSNSFPPALGVTITDISFPSLLGDKGKSRECSDTVNRASPAPGKWSPLRADLCGSAAPCWSCPGRTTAHGKGRGSKGRCPCWAVLCRGCHKTNVAGGLRSPRPGHQRPLWVEARWEPEPAELPRAKRWRRRRCEQPGAERGKRWNTPQLRPSGHCFTAFGDDSEVPGVPAVSRCWYGTLLFSLSCLLPSL